MAVRKTTLAKHSQLHTFFTNGDFLDCYSVRISRPNVPIAEVAQRLFIGLPRWINALLAARDIGVTLFGLKTTANLPTNLKFRTSIEVGDHINFLCVRSVSDNEIILGEDDSHLDFKISVCRENETSDQIFLATWVRTHNRLGRIYLRTIAPFHVRIAKSRLKALARHFA